MLLGVFPALLALLLLSTSLSFLPSTTGPGDGFWSKSTHWPQGAALSSVCHLHLSLHIGRASFSPRQNSDVETSHCILHGSWTHFCTPWPIASCPLSRALCLCLCAFPHTVPSTWNTHSPSPSPSHSSATALPPPCGLHGCPATWASAFCDLSLCCWSSLSINEHDGVHGAWTMASDLGLYASSNAYQLCDLADNN